MSKLKTFIQGTIDEITTKVTWPSYKALQSSSSLVLVTSFVFAVVIGLIDGAFKNLIFWFYNAF